tara:strand:- start:39 stop:410 length:372 start_codon:yes stop_codon:yes gene_type:complete
VRKLSILICLILIATSCSNDSDSEEVLALKEKVSTLEKKLDNAVNESKSDSVWNSEYQEVWMEVCETILEYEEENNPKVSASKVCGCSLDGLMSAFTLKDYDSWPQNVKDGAASPYVHRCWPE